METFKDDVRRKYGDTALHAGAESKVCCDCGSVNCCCAEPIASELDDNGRAAPLPDGAMLAAPGSEACCTPPCCI